MAAAMSAAYSPGWSSRVELGPGQERVRLELQRSIRHRSRTWHDAPRMREFERSSSTAHRILHRLAALGVIAIQTTLGSSGGTRFTFGVRYWRRGPVRRGQLARMRAPSPGQIELLSDLGPATELRTPPVSPGPLPSRGPARGGQASAGPFSELMRRAGFEPWWRE
jgi:hypothetical protein